MPEPNGSCAWCEKEGNYDVEAERRMEDPIRLCRGCNGLVTRGFVPLGTIIAARQARRDIDNLCDSMNSASKHITALYGAQEDVEAALADR